MLPSCELAWGTGVLERVRRSLGCQADPFRELTKAEGLGSLQGGTKLDGAAAIAMGCLPFKKSLRGRLRGRG